MPLIQNTSDVGRIMAEASFNIIDSKLEAVNLCMRAIGREGVDSLDSGDLDAEDANKIIDIVSQRFQYNKGGGWWFNREPNWLLKPDTNGEVNLPNDCLAVLQCYALGERKVPMTMRAGKLYSVWNHSFDMTKYVNRDGRIRLTLVMLLPFEHLPASVMQAIAYQAAVEFIVSKDADKTKLQAHQQIAAQLMIDVQSEQSSQKRLNMLVHNPTQRNFGIMAGGSQNVPAFSHSPYDTYPIRPWEVDH
ncbi:tail fibers protein [Citrobacter phage vB_CroP_CrRp3]|uniref:Tail fibers protein n=1 Tax=Citrobacter phage vB_CroP_CrRp3 TaxID=2079275 RepID=A0A2K9VAW8_9CAUD|nr:tail protein [Citrobacter phage vB_CroP_CrRp3]AUV59351.1 tail fibers protein [Citrobacter phage vB_CroP_CrRp3]